MHICIYVTTIKRSHESHWGFVRSLIRWHVLGEFAVAQNQPSACHLVVLVCSQSRWRWLVWRDILSWLRGSLVNNGCVVEITFVRTGNCVICLNSAEQNVAHLWFFRSPSSSPAVNQFCSYSSSPQLSSASPIIFKSHLFPSQVFIPLLHSHCRQAPAIRWVLCGEVPGNTPITS